MKCNVFLLSYFLLCFSHVAKSTYPWNNCNGHNHICIGKSSFCRCQQDTEGNYWPVLSSCQNCSDNFYCSDYDTRPCVQVTQLNTKNTIELSPYQLNQITNSYENRNCSFVDQRLPDKTGCSLYYQCVKNSHNILEKQPRNCPDETVFDPIRLTCTNNLAACTISPPDVPKCTCDDINIPDPLTNNYYFVCERKVSFEFYYIRMPCEKGNVFNVTSGACDVTVQNYLTPKSCGSPQFQKIVTENDCCVPRSQSKNIPLYHNSKCPAVGVFPDANDCRLYYICHVDPCTKTLVRDYDFCPGFTYFDPILLTCTSNAKKCLCTTDKYKFRCTNTGTFPDPECPSRFYRCYRGPKITYVPRKKVCALGTTFDQNMKICTNKTSYEIQHAGNKPSPCSSESRSADINSSTSSSSSEEDADCNSLESHSKSGKTKNINSKYNSCSSSDGSEENDSKDSSSSSSEESNSSSSNSDSDKNSSDGNCDYGSVSSEETERISNRKSYDSSLENSECPLKEQYAVFDDKECYYDCDKGFIVKKKCPTGHLFESRLKKCLPSKQSGGGEKTENKVINNIHFEINNIV